MSDEKEKSSKGRWDHLLREIPSQTKTTPIQSKEEVVEPKTVIPQQSFSLQSEHDEPEQESEDLIYTVSEINKAIKSQLEGEFSYLWLQGELSNFKAHTSGHYYFSLKDSKSQINGVMFKGYNSRLKFRPESGMEVLVRGKITVYEPRGNYQIFCEHMEPLGAGALQKAFEQLKAKLDKEGLFRQDLKKTIPPLPQSVGVITSPTGAAIQDILNVLERRSKRLSVTVIPARVQGAGSAEEIVKGIELANQVGGFDVLIVGRGGGSIEDLWCFNEEIVARAIFNSKIPIISAVGHEIDFTISDFVADLRAPTPSAAAEVVAKSEEELVEKLKFFTRSLRLMIFQKISDCGQQLNLHHKRLLDPRKYVEDSILRLDDWSQRLIQSMGRQIKSFRLNVKALQGGLINPLQLVKAGQERNKNLEKWLIGQITKKVDLNKNDLIRFSQMLDSLSPLRTLDRGYAIVRSDGKLIPDCTSLKNETIEIELRDGFLDAKVQAHRIKEKK